MYILNLILLASGILFVIAMFFICFGMFSSPRQKKLEPDEALEYQYKPSLSGRHIIDADDMEPSETDNNEISENTADAENESDTVTEASDKQEQEDNHACEPEEKEASADESNITKSTEQSETPKTQNAPEKLKSTNSTDSNSKRSSHSIEVCVTIIDTNKKKNVVVENEILIGRNPKCDIVINKPMVSAAHCVLIREGRKLMAEDNNSTNGTMLNGKPLNHVIELKNNDVLTLGDRSIRINFV